MYFIKSILFLINKTATTDNTVQSSSNPISNAVEISNEGFFLFKFFFSSSSTFYIY